MSPEEMVAQWDGLAIKIARSKSHQVPKGVFEDLLQACRIGLLLAARSFMDTKEVPWPSYAAVVIRRLANQFIRVERRYGFTNVFDSPSMRDVAIQPLKIDVDNLDQMAVKKDDPPDDLCDLIDWLSTQGLGERTMAIVEKIANEGMTQTEIAHEWGVSRQRIEQLLRPVRGLLVDVQTRRQGTLRLR